MKQLMAANWKMYKLCSEAQETTENFLKLLHNNLPANREVLILPPLSAAMRMQAILAKQNNIFLGAQNFYPAREGAYTGEISPIMLKDLGISHALVGHSERRHILGESDELIAHKVAFGLEQELCIILCIGETLDERKNDAVETILETQLESGLAHIPAPISADKIVIAYEPVWAIGTGEIAGPAEITHAHKFIRTKIKELLPEIASEMRLLYGGSVKPQNCADIMALDNVDGVLVGGASLQAESFFEIVTA